jgi:hypothetical protein
VAMHMEGYKKMKIEKEEPHGKRKATGKWKKERLAGAVTCDSRMERTGMLISCTSSFFLYSTKYTKCQCVQIMR